jgi:hypothetical protein
MFAVVYEERNRLGVIVARIGRRGFEAYAADDHCLGLFLTPREASAAIYGEAQADVARSFNVSQATISSLAAPSPFEASAAGL